MSLAWIAMSSMGSRNMPDSNRVTNADIAAFVEGAASKAARQRVLAAALVDADVRRRIALLQAAEADAETDMAAEVTPGVERLTAFVLDSIHEMQDTRMQLRQAFAEWHKGGGLWSVSEDVHTVVQDTLRTATDKALSLGQRIPLGLPCFAPASASPMHNSLDVIKQVVPTRDGVRVEFHQLPGTPPRFRVLVDASEHHPGEDEIPLIQTTEDSDFGYNVAYLTLEDSEGEKTDRHVLIVALNGQGRGFTEFSLGGEGIYAMPQPKGQCRLIGISLSQVWGDAVGEGGGGIP